MCPAWWGVIPARRTTGFVEGLVAHWLIKLIGTGAVGEGLLTDCQALVGEGEDEDRIRNQYPWSTSIRTARVSGPTSARKPVDIDLGVTGSKPFRMLLPPLPRN